MARVVIEHLTKVFPGPGGGGVRAVEDACLTVADQELLVLVGPSGCGKTTTLRLIAGLEEPSQGTVAIGLQGALLSPQDRDVAMVFQGYALYPHDGARKHRIPAQDARRIARAAPRASTRQRLRWHGGLLDRRPGELSGGERQRVAMGARHRAKAARILVRRAALEPLMLPCACKCARSSPGCTPGWPRR